MDLTAQNLIFSYGNRKIIDQPALELTPGKLTFLLGANGSGKSTLLKLLSGLLKPEQGDIFLNGTSLQKISYHSRAKHIGVMLQQRLPALDFSAEEFVLLGRTPKLPRLAAPGKSHKDAVNHALSLLDMEKFAKRPANRLSGGEFQRLCLASVLALESEILLLDEPVSAQDPARAAFIFELLKQLAAQKTILVISHGLELANRYAERLLLFSNGSVFADGTPREIMTQDNLNKLYDLPGFTAVPGDTFHFQREQAQK